MSIINYKDTIIPDWNRDENGKKISELRTNEQKQVIGNKIILDYLPDIQNRVFINDTFVEIDIKKEITLANQFKVNYEAGYITVHESLDGQFITIERYYARGVIYYPSSRIWYKLDINGNVSQTLDEAFTMIDTELIQKAHIHLNKTVTDKLTEVDGKVVYNGKAIGGATLGTVQPTDGSTWLKVIG